jgi:hypothetical protein
MTPGVGYERGEAEASFIDVFSSASEDTSVVVEHTARPQREVLQNGPGHFPGQTSNGVFFD